MDKISSYKSNILIRRTMVQNDYKYRVVTTKILLTTDNLD